MKKCSACKISKSIELFNKNIKTKDGRQNQCRECKKTYEQKDSARYRRQSWKLKNRYGITVEEKENMRIEQKNKCAICKNEFRNEKDVCVDHDHKTDQVRKLLCNNCNIGLGAFMDNPQLLIYASQYLIDFTC